MFACGGGKFCYNNLMNKIVNVLKKYMYVVSIFIVVSIILGVSYSNFIVTSNNHKAAEMYIGALKYSIEIDNSSTNTLTIPTGETIIDVKINNLNPVDTYYKLLYLKNSNLTVEYYETTKDTDDVVTTYSKPNDSITNSNSNTIKLKITNPSTASQNIGLSVKGGYITNTVNDITTPSTYSEITLADTSTNTYFCNINDSLTQGLKYENGQYTYAYKQKGQYASSGIAWKNITNNGWGVQLTDKTSADAVTSKLCTYINNKPIISMSYMFGLSQATTLDLSSFDTSNVTDMYYMFYKGQATILDVSNFDTSKVTNMDSMFRYSQASTLDVTNFNTTNVRDMRYMFSSSQSITIKGLENFDTSKVTNMDSMFRYSQATTIDVSNFNTSNVTSMYAMFDGSQATTIDVSNFDTSNMTSMFRMFGDTKATTIDVSKFNTSKVKDMTGIFSSSQAITLDLSSFDTSKVTSMREMFKDSQATTIKGLENFDTSKVTDMNQMFAGSQATTINVSNFDTSNVTSMGNMFSNSKVTILDLSNFNTSNVTSMYYMFSNSQVTTLDLSNFDTSNVTNMSSMFSSSQATTLDVSNFDTSNVTNMSYMFRGSKVTILDLSSFDTSNVTSMYEMFNNATNLKTIYASEKFNTDNVTNSSYMFQYASKLVGGAGTTYDSKHVDKTYAHIDGGEANPGYFTDIADKPKEPESFATDSWPTIVNAVKTNNISKYNVGDTRTIDMGTYGIHTIRIANTSTPSECSTTSFSQSACGFVLEFADIITRHNMNDGYATNLGGWPASSMYAFVNNDIYNAIPDEIKNAIIDTTVVSGHGSRNDDNFTSTDKLYLLSTAEIWTQGSSDTIDYDSARDNTRQLDYYSSLGTSTSNYSGAIKKDESGDSWWWWLRTAYSNNYLYFYDVNTSGVQGGHKSSNATIGISPAFRIG